MDKENHKQVIAETKLAEVQAREWLSSDEIAIYLGYKKKTIYNWTSKVKIPFRKPYGKLMFNKKEIDEWLEENGIGLKKQKQINPPKMV